MTVSIGSVSTSPRPAPCGPPRHSATFRRTRPGEWNGRTGPRSSVPTGSSTATTPKRTRSDRSQARTAWENAIREEHETGAATDPDVATRHETVAGMWRAMEAKATQVADL